MQTELKAEKKVDTSQLLPEHLDRIGQWIEALRSDRYSKGKKTMRDLNNNFCVMGVACDVSKQGKWTLNKSILESACERHPLIYEAFDDPDDWEYGALPKAVFRYYGFHFVKCSPYVMLSNVLIECPGYYGLTNISNINDSTPRENNDNLEYSFKAIANLIEQTYLQEVTKKCS